MRKMKKFLAVALSAAMVLSVSVPAMAAGTDYQQAYEDAVKKEAAAQEAYNEASAELTAAMKLMEALGDNTEIVNIEDAIDDLAAELEDYGYDTTDGIIAAAEDYVSYANDEKKTAEQAVKDAEDWVKACADELKAKQLAKLAADEKVNKLLKTIRDQQAIIDDEKSTPEQITAAEAAKAAAEAALGSKDDPAGTNTAYGALNEAKAAYDDAYADYLDAEKDLEDAQDDLADANAELVYAMSLLDYAGVLLAAEDDFWGTVEDLAAEIRALQTEVAETLAALNAAKEETRAAYAKINEEGKQYSEELYNEAKIREALAAEILDRATEKLNDAKATLAEIQAVIDELFATANGVPAAQKKYDDAVKAAADAASALTDAKDALAIQQALFDQAVAEAENTPEEAARIARKISLALSDGRLLSEDPRVVSQALKDIEQLENALADFLATAPEADARALINATAKLQEATDALAAAQDDWNQKSLAVKTAEDELLVAVANADAAQAALDEIFDFSEEETPYKEIPKDDEGEICWAGDYDELSELGQDYWDALDDLDPENPGSAQWEYDRAKELHDEAVKNLNDAIEKYEYYHGYKPGEEPQPEPKPIPTNFTDVKESDWFAPYVADVVEKGLMKGMNATFFGSYSQLQRQDFCMILWRMAGEPVVNYAASYKDVDANGYYAQAVAWAASTGIMKGYADTGFTVFGVGDNITREDFVVALHRFYNYPTSSQDLSYFADASKVSLYAKDAMKWAVETGAITGKEGGLIDPQAPIARCEAAKIFSVITDVA